MSYNTELQRIALTDLGINHYETQQLFKQVYIHVKTVNPEDSGKYIQRGAIDNYMFQWDDLERLNHQLDASQCTDLLVIEEDMLRQLIASFQNAIQ